MAASTPPSLPVSDAKVEASLAVEACDDEGVPGCDRPARHDGMHRAGGVRHESPEWHAAWLSAAAGPGAARDLRLAPVPEGEREALADVLLASWRAQGSLHPPFDTDRSDALTDADAILAAGYRRPEPTPDGERPDLDAVNTLARVLITEWERVEGPVTASYVANFADMARAALAHRADDSRVVREVRALVGQLDALGQKAIAYRLRRILAGDAEATGGDRG